MISEEIAFLSIFRCRWNFRCYLIPKNYRVAFLPPRSKSTIDAYSNNENENENENENDYKIEKINDYFETTDKSKSFEDQIKINKKSKMFI